RVRLAARVRGVRRRGRRLGGSLRQMPPPEHAATRRPQMNGLAAAALDLLYPAVCPVCDRALDAGRRDPLCRACVAAVERVEPPFCATCGLPWPSFEPASPVPARCHACLTAPPPFDYARAAGAYGGVLREALHALK